LKDEIPKDKPRTNQPKCRLDGTTTSPRASLHHRTMWRAEKPILPSCSLRWPYSKP